MIRNLFFCFAVALIAIAVGKNINSARAETMIVKYPKPEADAFRYAYHYELVEQILIKTESIYGPYQIVPYIKEVNTQRKVKEFMQGEHVNLFWSPPQDLYEKNMRVIRIPILKGLLGYRIFLIRKKDQAKFSSIKTIEDLRKYTVGQGKNWADVKVYEHNNIKVVKGNRYEHLFGMLARGRFDYFARGINEVFPEFQAKKNHFPIMHVEESILLYYPYPVFIYVHITNERLAERIEQGLGLMIEDGSFDKLFFKYHSSMIEKANLKGRKVFRIENPFIPESTPLNRNELWYDPTR